MPDDTTAAPSVASTTAPASSDDSAVSSGALPTQASAGATDADAAAAPGPLPFERHKAILDKAYGERDQLRQEYDQYKQQYGWASQIDRGEFDRIAQWSRAYSEDPVRWMADTISELRQTYPHLAPALTSEAARILAGSRGFEREPDIEPDIPVLDAQGQQVSQTFGADNVKRLIQRAVNDAVMPLKEYRDQQESTARAQKEQARVREAADAQWERAQKWHGFTEHEKAIEAAFTANPTWTLSDAYLHVLHTEILPKLDLKSQGKLLTQLQTQAAGASVQPGATTPTAPPKFKNFKEAAQYYEKHPDEAEAMATRG